MKTGGWKNCGARDHQHGNPGRVAHRDWLAELQAAAMCLQVRRTTPVNLIALAEIEPLVRNVPLDANGFRRSRMISVLEMIRDDLPCDKPIEILRQPGQRPYRLHNGVHRYYASRALGFTHVPADVIDPYW
jgi:hypothetical protein